MNTTLTYAHKYMFINKTFVERRFLYQHFVILFQGQQLLLTSYRLCLKFPNNNFYVFIIFFLYNIYMSGVSMSILFFTFILYILSTGVVLSICCGLGAHECHYIPAKVKGQFYECESLNPSTFTWFLEIVLSS